MSLSFILYEVLDSLLGTGHQTGVLLQKLQKQPVHVAVGVQRPQGIPTLLSICKAGRVCVCVCVKELCVSMEWREREREREVSDA